MRHRPLVPKPSSAEHREPACHLGSAAAAAATAPASPASHDRPGPRLLRLHRRRQQDHLLPARRRRPDRRRHRRRRPAARRAGPHRPHPDQPFAPRPRAVDRPARRQRDARAAPARGADPACTRCPRRSRRCARTSSTASSGPTSRACRAPSIRCWRSCRSPSASVLELGRQAHRGAAPRRTPCRRSASPSMAATAGWWVYTGDTGPNPALWERLRAHEGRAPGHRDRVQRRRAPARPHQPPPVPGGARRTSCSTSTGSVDVHITHIKPGELRRR